MQACRNLEFYSSFAHFMVSDKGLSTSIVASRSGQLGSLGHSHILQSHLISASCEPSGEALSQCIFNMHALTTTGFLVVGGRADFLGRGLAFGTSKAGILSLHPAYQSDSLVTSSQRLALRSTHVRPCNCQLMCDSAAIGRLALVDGVSGHDLLVCLLGPQCGVDGSAVPWSPFASGPEACRSGRVHASWPHLVSRPAARGSRAAAWARHLPY